MRALAGLTELRNVTWVDLPTSHWPMWSRPQELAAIIGDRDHAGDLEHAASDVALDEDTERALEAWKRASASSPPSRATTSAASVCQASSATSVRR